MSPAQVRANRTVAEIKADIYAVNRRWWAAFHEMEPIERIMVAASEARQRLEAELAEAEARG